MAASKTTKTKLEAKKVSFEKTPRGGIKNRRNNVMALTDKPAKPGAALLEAAKRTSKRKNENQYTWRDMALVGVAVALFYSTVWILWLAR